MMKNIVFKLVVAVAAALVFSGQSFAQVGGDMDRARVREIERQNQQNAYMNNRNQTYGSGSGFAAMEDWEPFEKSKCPIIIKGGMDLGLSDGGGLGYNASVGLQFGGFSGIIFNPEIGIGSRFVDDDFGNVVNDYSVYLESMNLKVRPLQVGYGFYTGPLAMSIYGGVYA